MPRQHRPHVCSALQHLRSGVVVATLVLGICIGIHLLIWGFVHFTDVRWTQAEGAEPQQSLAVVEGAVEPQTTIVAPPPKGPKEGADANLVPSTADRSMSLVVSLVDAIGIITSLVLVGLMRQTVSVAAGASVPGINKLVTASSWASVLALVSIPLGRLIQGYPLPGIFGGYASITTAHAAVTAGSIGAAGYFAINLALPLVFAAGLAIIVFRYIQGVEEGVIATSVSDLDNKLAKEISGIKIGANSSPRAVGALNTAIGAGGDNGASQPQPQVDPVQDAIGNERGRRMGEASKGEPLGRPI